MPFRNHYIKRKIPEINPEVDLKVKILGFLVDKKENTFVIDSMPIQICQFSRAKRARICRDNYETSPGYGFCAAQNSHYYGYKLHGITTIDGVITSFDLSRAEVADIHYLKDIKEVTKENTKKMVSLEIELPKTYVHTDDFKIVQTQVNNHDRKIGIINSHLNIIN